MVKRSVVTRQRPTKRIQETVNNMPAFSDDMCLLSGPQSQEGIWSEHQTDPLSTKYNLNLSWDLSNYAASSTSEITEIVKGTS
ncbi:hypothetical protein QBC46DRAFT_345738 [Diplogelasinospora grovesii]|uniref:Uncharacterized protein n=1 Tax=Diplogelasinospora grovesii TaxID=303347 RepID=A0AAN6N0F8_9PEZI|nr:hypothetical protein QBC46DRAFT_345738 [Diplogelasinospora grovesii]